MTNRVKKGRRVTKPSHAPGVSIDRDGGTIFCTFEDVTMAVTVEWSIMNASMVRDMLTRAIEEGTDAKEDVTLASGLVIPGAPPVDLRGGLR